ncbi:hypothetical protein AB6A40_005403 [Gnathostoma spinigerum]|uniref:C2 domain-containing protein n=1 Tax=Gnathostoma spinigerum TaxID=75299 RepID=A0ABD6EMZ6_9BILA
MHGFLDINSYRKKTSNRPRKSPRATGRSLSLADRRGLITPPRGSNIGILSPVPSSVRRSLRRLDDQMLLISLLDIESAKDKDTVGEVVFPMKTVPHENTTAYCRNLRHVAISKNHSAGEILLSMCYLEKSNKLTVSVIRARDLPTKQKLGLPDPYVKIWLLHSGKKLEKQKTTVKSHTSDPVFNELFIFSVPSRKKLAENVSIAAIVMDRDFVHYNSEIGHTIIGRFGQETGVWHWKELLDHPHVPSTHWHKLSTEW